MTDELPAADSLPEADTPEVALPEQERFYRAPARFGHVPVAETPLGWDAKNRGFRNHYPHVRLPTQVVDRVSLGAPELEPNRLIWGDNLHAMRTLPSESVDLIYIDPPFFSNRVYNVIWGDEHEERSFSDIWEGGLDGYLIWLNARLYEMKRLLKPTGSIYVHCDWHASHYIKVEMDKIFGYENFQNEIVWGYRGMPSKAKKFQAKHDVILFYGASKQAVFNTITGPPTAGSLRTFESGRRRGYNANNAKKMVTVFDWGKYRKAVDRGVIPADLKPVEFKGGEPPLNDWWADIKILGGPKNKERVGYPTQKPEALLDRIIRASSNEGDMVLAGCFYEGWSDLQVGQRGGRSVCTPCRMVTCAPLLSALAEGSRFWTRCMMGNLLAISAQKRPTAAFFSHPARCLPWRSAGDGSPSSRTQPPPGAALGSLMDQSPRRRAPQHGRAAQGRRRRARLSRPRANSRRFTIEHSGTSARARGGVALGDPLVGCRWAEHLAAAGKAAGSRFEGPRLRAQRLDDAVRQPGCAPFLAMPTAGAFTVTRARGLACRSGLARLS